MALDVLLAPAAHQARKGPGGVDMQDRLPVGRPDCGLLGPERRTEPPAAGLRLGYAVGLGLERDDAVTRLQQAFGHLPDVRADVKTQAAVRSHQGPEECGIGRELGELVPVDHVSVEVPRGTVEAQVEANLLESAEFQHAFTKQSLGTTWPRCLWERAAIPKWSLFGTPSR